jgi:hypothetical protein
VGENSILLVFFVRRKIFSFHKTIAILLHFNNNVFRKIGEEAGKVDEKQKSRRLWEVHISNAWRKETNFV